MRRATTATAALTALALLTVPLAVAAEEPSGGGEPVRAADAGFPLRSGIAGTAEVTPDLLLRGQGWGHGVGMSQFGAFAQALDGRSAEQILTFYYSGTQLATDTRASEQRIRAGIATDVSRTNVEALDGEVTWRICTPEDSPAGNGRVPASRCATWFTQSAGEELHLEPIRDGSVTTSAGVVGHPATGGTDVTELVELAGADEEVDAPNGGLVVLRGDEPHRAYVTPEDGRAASGLPVARVDHGSTRITAQSYANPDRVYAHGWRDLHLTGDRVADPTGHRLTLVQDVDTVERYLRGLAEVPSSWPAAALQAQAITGRTYALRGWRGGACRCDRLATAADQVFIGESKVEALAGDRWAQAVADTRDQVLTYTDADGSTGLAQTFYSSSFGARSENVEDSWAFYRAYQDQDRLTTDPPPSYLRSVDDPWSRLTEVNGTAISNSRRDWTATASNAAFATLVNRERDHLGQPRFDRIEGVRIDERTEGGTPRTLLVTGTTTAGERETMTYRGIRSFDGTREITLARPIAGANLRMELPLVDGGESNGRLSSSQVRSIGFGPFTDDDGSVHEYAIAWAAEVGVVSGVSDTRFAPGRSVNRGQMATFLVNTFQIPAATLDEPFTDVPADATHRASIEALVAAGVASGFGDDTFGPEQPVTRAQMATFLANALGWSTATRGTFTDVPDDDVHGPNIEAIAEGGVTTGCAPDRYCGGDPVQRGQLTAFLYRVVAG